MPDHTLVGISGSLRAASANRKLIREAARVYGAATFIEADIVLPLFNADDQARDGVPEAVMTLARQISDADGVVISTPEYNKGISGALKNAFDWLSRGKPSPWTDKPVAIMSASSGRGGGERAQMMLRHCLAAFRPRLVGGPDVLLADCNNAFDEDDRLLDPKAAQFLGEQMIMLRREILRGALPEV